MNLKYLLFIVFFIACTKGDEDVEILALVNGIAITKTQLVSRLELTPVKKSDASTDLVDEVLNILIDEIVVSQWAKKKKYNHKEDYINGIAFAKKQALIRELFYVEIRDKSIPGKKEIDRAFQKSLEQTTIEILFTQEQDISAEWSKLVGEGKTFTEIEMTYDRNLSVQKSEISYHWGDSKIPPKVQMVSSETKVGGISSVFKVPLGFGILSVSKRERDISINSSGKVLERQEIFKILQARKEDMLASMYTAKLLEKVKVEQLGHGFKEIGSYLESMANLNAENGINAARVMNLELRVKNGYDLSLVVVKGPDFQWNGNDVLVLLQQYNLSFENESIESISKTLARFLKGAVRDYYLEKRAQELGLDSNVRVRDDIEMWDRYFLYLMGLQEMIEDDSKRDAREILREEINILRSKATISLNSEMIKTIRVTGIPMLGLWSTDLSKNLAVPPLLNFRN